MPLSRPGASQVPGVNAVYSCPCPGGVRLSPPSAACGGKAYLFIWYFIWGGLFTEMKKRLFALFLCLCMVMTLLPVGAFAEGTEAQSGLAAGGASVTSVNPVETPDTHITFKFYNGETLLDTQVVNGDGQLTAPATPAIEGGRKFLGWYAVDVNDQLEAQEFDFSTAYTNYSGRSEVKVMAKFEAVFYVYFMTVDGQVHSTAIANAANGFKVTPPTDYEPNGKVVTGWVVGNDAFTADTVVRADTYVHPVTADCYWVTFNTTGGSMVASRSVTKGDTLNLRGVTAPTRTGYSFKGWSTTADGANVVNSIAPTADTTLYAVWEGKDVTYTVVYWGENADDTKYSTLATATLTGKVGSTVTLDKITGALPKSVSDRQHFKFSRSDSATIRADGSSVLNVYFSRNSYKLTFREYTGGFFSGSYHTVATITAKYNASIFAEFGKPPFNTTYNGRAWECTDSSKYNYALQTLDRMPGFDATFDLYDKSSNKLKTIYYYVQNVGTTVNSSRWPTSTANFSLYKEVQTYFNYATYDEEYHNIDGFNRYSASVAGFYRNQKDFSNNTLYLYYMRKSYTLTFNNYGAVSDNTVEYEAKLDSYNNYVPARPEGFSENAVFMGWYEVEPSQITSTTQRFDFTGKTMPADNLTLFAYWVEQPVTLTVQVPTLDYTASNDKVAIGTVISGVDVFKDAETKIADAGKTVLKWVYEDGTAVDVNSAIDRNTTVKAVLEGEVYTLTYVTGTTAAITDENRYEYEALAQVKDGSGLKSGDKVFACWTDETGKVYYPGSYVTMTGNKTLTANYVDPSVKVTLTYHSNFDTDQTKTIDAVPNNDKVTVMAYDATGMTTRPGYEFKGWADKADADTANYPAGSEARLDNDGSNDLYAVWEAINVDYTVRYLWNGTEDKVADDKVVADQTVGQTITETPITVGGYTAVSTDSQSITLVPDSSSNVITFYYYKNVELTANSATHEYNGIEQSVSGFTGTPEDADFSAITVGAKGTDAGVYPAKFADGTVGTVDATGKYIVTEANDGSLTITAKAAFITITANSKTREYNGEALTDNGCTFTEGVLVDGDVLQAVVEGSQTKKGSSANVVKSYKVVRGSDDVTGNYKFADSVDGTLTVTPRVVVIESEGGRRVYNGQPLTNPNYKFTTGSFVAGEVSEVKTTGTITEVGSVDNTIVYTTTDKFDANNYDITLTPGKLEITPVTAEVVVTITENSGSAKYDGTEKTVTGYVVTSISDPLYKESYFTFSGDATIKGTDAGTYDMNLAPEAFKNINGNFKNVRFVINDGTLVISPRPLTITSGSDNKEYDGTPLTSSEIKVTGDGFVDGEGASYTFTGSQLDVGSSKNTFDYELNDNTKAKNYEIAKEYGDLTVTAVSTQIVITAASDSKVYDGQPLTNGNYTYTGKLADGDKLEVEVVGSQTDKGSSDNVVKSYKVTRDGVDVTNNYTFGASQKGTLTVTPRPVTLTSGGGEKEYDGTPLTNPTVTVGGSGFVAGEGATYNVTGSQLDEGSSNNSFTYELNEGTLAANYIIETKEGELTVKPILTEITITANSGEKMYDGFALINGGYTFTSGILVDGDVLTAVVEGSQLNAGSSANVVKSYRVMRGETDVTANYRFAESVDGKLTVTARKVVMTSADDEKVYDGTPLTNDEITVTGDGFIEGEGVTYDVTGSQLDVGSSDNSFTYELNEGTLAENYIIETEEGKLTVTSPEQHIVITANSAEKTYDGTPLTDDGFTYTDFVLAEGDVLEAVIEGSQTDAGSSVNVIKSYRVMRGDEDVTANYIFDDSVDGTLTVTKRKVTLTSGTACKIYDGKYLTCNKVEVGGDGFVEGEGATYDVTGKRKDIGWSYNDFTYKLNDNTKADNYEITVERGFLYVKDQAEKPKTGDSSDLLLLLALMSMSGAGAAGTVYLYRRKREEQE